MVQTASLKDTTVRSTANILCSALMKTVALPHSLSLIRLLVDDDKADAFRIEVYSLLGDKLSSIPLRTRAFWDEA